MRLTVLGCNGPYPAPKGACSGYLLESDSLETRLLLDCGCGVLGRLSTICTPDRLSGIVLSHLHYDHMSDMLPMIYALQKHPPKRELPVFAPESPVQVRSLLECPWMELRPARDVTLGEMEIRFIPAVHPVESVCVSVECDGQKFVYTGDTNENMLLELFAGNADLLLADAGFLSANWTPQSPHLSAELCGKLANAARAQRLLLTHINPNDDTDALLAEAKCFFTHTEIARPGGKYVL